MKWAKQWDLAGGPATDLFNALDQIAKDAGVPVSGGSGSGPQSSVGADSGGGGKGSGAADEALKQINQHLETLMKATALLVSDSESRKLLENPWAELSSTSRSEKEREKSMEDIHKRAREYFQLNTIKGLKDMYGYEYSDLDSTQLPTWFVRAAHVWPAKRQGRGLELFDLGYQDALSPRNFLFLPRTVEKHFDSMSICFDYDFIHKTFVTNILDPKLMAEPLFVDSKSGKNFRPKDTLGSLQGKALCLGRQLPFRRLLDHHAEFAHRNAALSGWNPALREQFGNASDSDEKSNQRSA